MGCVTHARAIAISLAAAGIFQATLSGQAGRSTWDGVYSAEQAQRGDGIYRKECASCHGETLDGQGPTPPLAGDDFKSNWNGQTLKDLFDKIQTTMPADHPGKLSRQETADILAFMLGANKFPAGKTALGSNTEALARIRFDTARPKN
jgi:mono/diheme cytochrome c family protein